MFKRWLLLFSFVGLIAFTLLALIKRDDGLNAISSYFEQLRSDYPGEKVHLHFDKPYYSIGDDIWFKAYVVTAEKDELSPLSKVLYVDVIDAQDSVRRTLTLPLTNGLTNGSIKLTDSIFNAGNYRIRAYTRWMENFDSSYFFDKQVQIGDALNSNITATSAFTVTPGKNEQMLTAEINYRDLNNQTKTLKPVSYSLLYNDKNIFSGSGQTDLAGNIKVTVPVKNSYPVNQLVLNTVIKPDNVASVSRNFPVVNTANDVDVQFFPEGGNLVNGIRSKVAFKAIGTNGLGAEVEGYIEDQNKTRLVDLKSEHAGMGLFAFAPQQGNQYIAVMQLRGGIEKRVNLPVAKSEGYVLSINNINDKELSLRITASAGMPADKELVLIAQCNNVVQYVNKVKLDGQTLATSLSKKYFTTGGIVHFTLFTPDYSPIAERLVFIERKKLEIDVKTDKQAYTKRQQVNMQLKVTDILGEPVVGAFSASVTNQGKVNTNEDDEVTIYSNLLLTSDLKGYVEKPNYYFSTANENRNRHLDILMLTQGWSRFKWEDVKANKFPVLNYKPEQSLTVSGHVVTLNNKPMPNAKLTLLAPTLLLSIDTVADAQGNFIFKNVDMDEGTKFVIKAKNANNRNNAKIIIDEPNYTNAKSKIPYPNYSGINPAFVTYLKSAEGQFTEMQKYGLVNKGSMLKEVVIKSKAPPAIYNSIIVDPWVKPDVTITPAQMEGSANLIDQFRGIFNVKVMGNVVLGRWPSAPRPRYSPEGAMLILLDGQIINDLTGVVVPALSGVQIFKHGADASAIGAKYGGGMIAEYGVIVLTTETRVTKYNTKPNYSVNVASNRGYSAVREFYSPAYKVNDDIKMADLRSTIYWKPDLITDKEGKADLKFYTADEPGTYLVTIEGLDTNGHLVRRTYNFDVKL